MDLSKTGATPPATFRPLASLLIAVLITDPLLAAARPWKSNPVERIAPLAPRPAPVEASASAVADGPKPAGAQGGCAPTQNRIIQKVCEPGMDTQAVLNFENRVIQDWLGQRGLPASDQDKIYKYGRADLRNEIRAYMFQRLMEIGRQGYFSSDGFYTWFRNRMYEKEKAYLQAAAADMHLFTDDICRWRLNPDIAAQYKLNVDTSPWCGGVALAALFKGVLVPKKDYFLSVGLYQVYENPSGQDPAAPDIVARSANAMLETFGWGSLAAVAGGATVGTAAAAGTKLIFPFASSAMRRSVLKIGTEIAKRTISNLGRFAGPAIIITLAIEIGVQAGEQAVENDKNFAEIKTIDDDLNRLLALSSAPHISYYIDDPRGYMKLNTTFMDLTMPEFSSSVPPPGPPATPLVLRRTAENGTVTETQRISFRDHFNGQWNAYPVNGWFGGTGKNAAGVAQDMFQPTLRYTTWDGKQYLLAILKNRFVVVRDIEHEGPECAANILTGVTDSGLVPGCHRYVSSEVKLKDEGGNNYTLAIPEDPVLSAPESIAFTKGSSKTVDLGATGYPLPAIILTGGSLPAGVIFQGSSTLGSGLGRIVYDGVGGDATQTIQVSAKSGDKTVTKNVKLYIRTAPQITSPNFVDIHVGLPVNFKVTATGSLPITLHMDDGVLPPGVTFNDEGGGVGTISGTYNGEFITVRCLPLDHPCGITATPDVLEPVRQSFSVFTYAAPKPVEVTPTIAEMIPGIENESKVAIKGVRTTPHFQLHCAPAWLSLIDHGDGTATLKANPPNVDGITDVKYMLARWAQGDGSTFASGFFPLCTEGVKDHTIRIVPDFRFLDGNTAYLIAGQGGAALIEVNQNTNSPNVTITGAGHIPDGVTFNGNAGSSFISFSGTPPAGSGGEYPYEITVQNQALTSTIPFLFVVREKPSILAPDEINVYANSSNRFSVTASGYPMTGMELSVDGSLPGSMTLTTEDQPVGHALLAGNPGGTLGDFNVTLRAKNGPTASFETSKTLTIHVVAAGDANSDGSVSCLDVDFVRAQFGKRNGYPDFDVRADVNGDGLVDLRDIAVVARATGGASCD